MALTPLASHIRIRGREPLLKRGILFTIWTVQLTTALFIACLYAFIILCPVSTPLSQDPSPKKSSFYVILALLHAPAILGCLAWEVQKYKEGELTPHDFLAAQAAKIAAWGLFAPLWRQITVGASYDSAEVLHGVAWKIL
jgi:hypothetical protein